MNTIENSNMQTQELSLIETGPSLPDEYAVSAEHVSKMYPLYADPRDRLKQSLWYALPGFLRGTPPEFYKEFWALRDVSFTLKRGEALGIIGHNGSGKSTLLQLIATTLRPTGGTIRVNGRVAALLELGSGFNPEFTGRENVYLNGAILGFSREEMDALFDEIEAFADIGQFIDQPVKLYSSGMFVRLAFAVQACVEPDILIVDEALSVGDIFFQQKCHARMEDLLARRTAVIIVSHDMTAIEKYSNQVILLDKGECKFIGDPDEAIQRYVRQMESKTAAYLLSRASKNEAAALPAPAENAIPDFPAEDAFLELSQAEMIAEHGDIAVCTGVALCDTAGEARTSFEIGETAVFYAEFEFLQNIEVPIGGYALINAKNVLVNSKNSLHERLQAPATVTAGMRMHFRQEVELGLAPGEYTFNIGLATIAYEEYERLLSQPYADYPTQKVLTILLVQQAGRFFIKTATHGISVPFHGYANLRSSCVLSVTLRDEEPEWNS